jgi:hypothetical protein
MIRRSAMPPAAQAAGTSTHSGTIAAVDPQGGVMIMEEVGPWRVKRGQPVVGRRIDFVTAECLHERGRLVAVRVTRAEVR